MNLKTPNKIDLEKYYLQGYSIEEIGKILGYSTGKTHKYFHIYDIKLREKGLKSEFAKIKFTNATKGKKRKSHTVSDETKKKISKANLKKGIGHKKIRNDGYVAIYFPDHPKSNKEGYIMEHDLVMECYIGRWLKDDEVVHHKNHIRDDNKIENLQLMTHRDHARLHMIERHRKERNEDLLTM